MADPNEAQRASVIEAKRELRQRMRTMRRELADRPERSARIVERLVSLGVMDLLASQVGRVGYFRPVIAGRPEDDAQVQLMNSRYEQRGLDAKKLKPSGGIIVSH